MQNAFIVSGCLHWVSKMQAVLMPPSATLVTSAVQTPSMHSWRMPHTVQASAFRPQPKTDCNCTPTQKF